MIHYIHIAEKAHGFLQIYLINVLKAFGVKFLMFSEAEFLLTGDSCKVIISFSIPLFVYSSAVEAFPLEVQEAEENFDLALIASFEIDVAPHLGDKRVPDDLVSQLAKVLRQGSRLYESEVEPVAATNSPANVPRSGRMDALDMQKHYELGSTESGSLVPRERFSYWCLDLLFLVCSNITNGKLPVSPREFCFSPWE